MNEKEIQQVLTFRVIEKGQLAFILWPWTSPTEFLYDALEWGSKYHLRSPAKISRHRWIEFVSVAESAHGEYRDGLYFGYTHWGSHMFRQFNIRSSHYLAQHGLDGLPQALWSAAMGQVKITFSVETKKGSFGMSFFDWLQYLATGQDGHLSQMGISITKSDR